MKHTIAEPTLNMLGWMAEKGTDFDDGQTVKGLIGHFGVRAAIRKSFLAIGSYTIEEPPPGRPRLPGMPYGTTYSGYVLTDLGKRLGEIGARYRQAFHDNAPDRFNTGEGRKAFVAECAAPYIAEAMQLLHAEAAHG